MKCRKPGKGDYQNFEQQSPYPFLLHPDNVKQAFKWERLILFETDKGLRAYDTSDGNEIKLPQAPANFSNINQARKFNAQLWLKSPDRLLILEKNEQDEIKETVFQGVSELIFDKTQHPWARFDNGWQVWDDNKFRLPGDEKAKLFAVEGESITPHRQMSVKDQWPVLKKNMTQLKNGKWAYDPVIDLISGAGYQLYAKTKGNRFKLPSKGVLQLDLPSALDAGWLQWDRSGKRFMVKTDSGRKAYDREKFIIDKKLLFEDTDAVLQTGDKQIFAANQYGIWMHNQPNLKLDNKSIVFQPVTLTRPIHAAHGRFMTSRGDYFVNENKLRKASQLHEVRFGDVSLTEQMWKRRITCQADIGGQKLDAYADRGFIWDLNRRHIALNGNNIFIQTKAGIHPVSGYSDFDSGPKNIAPFNGRLYSELKSMMFFESDNSWWYRHDSGSWKKYHENPAINRVLADNSQWHWNLQNGKIHIKLHGKTHKFSYGPGNSGFSFNSDQLVDAAAHDNSLYVMTQGFFEILNQAGPDLQNASRFPPSRVDKLESIGFTDGHFELFRTHRNSVTRWDSGQFKPVPRPENPYREHGLVQTGRLQFTAFPGEVQKKLKIENIKTGKNSWVPFDFNNRRFPFDVVKSIATQGNELLTGTAAGLQVYSGNLSTEFRNIRQFYGMENAAGDPVAVSAVGYPEKAPDLLIACFGTDCMERRDTSVPFTISSNGGLPDSRLRGRTDFWQWTADKKGKIYGQYKNKDGKYSSKKISVIAGRFPHDRLTDIALWNGQAFSMWESGWITVYSDHTLRLSSGVRNYDLTDASPKRFIHVEDDFPLEIGIIPQGLYFKGRGKHIWRFSHGNWIKEKSPVINDGILKYGDHPPIISRQRLRLLSPGNNKGYIFDQRSMNGAWVPLPWIKGRIGTDQWHELFSEDNRLWAATPIGLTLFSRDKTGQAVLDPDSLIVVREPAECRITDIKKEKELVLVRCEADSSKLYQGQLDNQNDDGVFEQYDGHDPFAEQNQVSLKHTGFWQWRMNNHKDGNPGSLSGDLRQDRIRLVGGRFSFDTINSMALFQPGQLEIGTDADGWLQASTKGNFHVKNVQRAAKSGIDSSEIDHVGITRDNNQFRLYLHTTNGDYIRLYHNKDAERTGRCSEYLGDDGFWRYLGEKQRLSAVAQNSIGGQAKRELSAGRFTDDILTGLPATGKDDKGVYYLWPTRAGVLHLNNDLKHVKIHVEPFQGLPKNTSPGGVYVLDNTDPVYVGQDVLYYLSESRNPVPNSKLDMPKDAVVYAVEDQAYGYLRIWWKNSEKRQWTMIRHDKNHLTHDNLYVDIKNFDKFAEHREDWGDPSPWLDIHIHLKNIDVKWPDLKKTFTTSIPADNFDLLKPIVSEERLLLFGK